MNSNDDLNTYLSKLARQADQPRAEQEYPSTVKMFFDQCTSAPAMTETVAPGQPHNVYWSTDVGADGDEYVFPYVSKGGTHTFDVEGAKSSTRGKTDIYLDTTKINGVTPFDWYNGSAVYAVHQTVTGVAVDPGEHTITVKINGKNASGGYKLAGTCVTVTRTGA